MKEHNYDVRVEWTGNTGQGTKTYKGYTRDHDILCNGKPTIHGSSDPNFRGDPSRHNPEELLVASVSSCHMLWYLHLCSVSRIGVLEYTDSAIGIMKENADGSGAFVKVLLRPSVIIAAGSDPDRARSLHHEAHRNCFIANSVRFSIELQPEITTE